MRISWRYALLIPFQLGLLSGAAVAQAKVEAAISAELAAKSRVRVLIITRPDPEAQGGGMALSSASNYVSQKLGDGAANVKAVGSFPIATAEINAAGLQRLNDDPNVARVIRDIPMPPTLVDTVPMIAADKAHQAGYRGAKYSVAVLDTGIQPGHPALVDGVQAEACFSTPSSTIYKLKSLCPQQLDVSLLKGAAAGCPADVAGCGHGTHVSGIIAGHNMVNMGKTFDGVAPATKVVAVQVFTLFEEPGECGGETRCVLSFTSDQLRALEWVFKNRQKHNIAAVNMSLGSGYYDKPCDAQSALTEVIERLKAKGVPTVVAAGNDAYYDGISEPACISHAVSVSALNKLGKLDVSYTNVAPFVTVAAPGTKIVSSMLGNTYESLSGTSMATPHVAAAFALLREMYPNDTYLMLLKKLKQSAPIVVDPRTDTPVAALSLAKSLPAAAAATPAGAPDVPTYATPPGSNTDGAMPTESTDGRTFIIRTQQSSNQLKATLDEGCPELNCDVKQVGKDTFKVEIAPKPAKGGEEPSNLNVEVRKFEDLIRAQKDMTIYDNRLSRPQT
jgi:subtilisin family serine protease